MKEVTHWNARFIELAAHIAKWSKDPSKQIGAVIVDKDKRIVSTGFNGFAKHVEDSKERLLDKEMKRALMLHAEENAILYAKQDLTGCNIYIAGLPPCIHCTNLIIQSGISTVYYSQSISDDAASDYWKENLKIARGLLWEAGICLIRV